MQIHFINKFTWNGDLSFFQATFRYHEWMIPIIHGYVGTFNIEIIEGILYL